MAINTFAILKDFAGGETLIRSAPEYVDARVVTASSAESHTVPSGADLVIFSSTGNFYAKPNAAAAIPAADVTNGSSSELNPTAWSLRPLSGTAITTIGLIAVADSVITMSFYKRAQ